MAADLPTHSEHLRLHQRGVECAGINYNQPVVLSPDGGAWMRNLLGRLLDRSPQSLAGIARSWEIDLRGTNLHHDVSHLYRTLTDPWNFAFAWDGLPPAERTVLRVFADGVPRDAERQIRDVELNPDDFLPALRMLYKAGYLYHNTASVEEPHAPVELFMPPDLASMIAQLTWEQEAGEPSAEPVPALLQRMDEAGLIELARELGHRFIPAVSQRAELASYIETRLTDPDYIDSSVQALDPQASQLWRWLIQHLLPAGPDDVRAALGFTSTDLRAAVHALARRGLIWRGYGDTGDDRCLRLVVPDAIRYPKRPDPLPQPDLVEFDANQVATGDGIHPDAAAWDLLTLLRERMSRSVVRLGNDSSRGAASFGRTNPQFWRGAGSTSPTGYLAFLDYLAVGLGLVADRDALVPVAERLTPWTRLSFEEQTRRMIEIWRNAAEWFEGATVESFHAWGADWPGLRGALLSALTELETDRWFTLDSFARRFAASHPAVLGAHVTVASANEPVDEPPTSRREGVVRRAAEITLMTACQWLGLVELVGIPKGPLMIRVTRRGSLIATGAEAEAGGPAREGPPLAVQPNFDIFLLTPSPRRVWALSAFAEGSHLDRVSIYRLTEQSVLRSLEAGVSVRNVVRFLEHQNGSPLPQNVAYALHEWGVRHRIVGVRGSLLLHVDGEAAAGEIERLLRERGVAAERLSGDRLLVALPQDGDATAFVERIARTLRDMGHVPRRE